MIRLRDVTWARSVSLNPERHSPAAIARACSVLEMTGDLHDWHAALQLRKAIDTDGADRTPLAWAVLFALMFGAIGYFGAWAIWTAISAIDLDAILRFVAPTAFETGPLDVLIEGRSGQGRPL